VLIVLTRLGLGLGKERIETDYLSNFFPRSKKKKQQKMKNRKKKSGKKKFQEKEKKNDQNGKSQKSALVLIPKHTVYKLCIKMIRETRSMVLN
jgi:hypothetical protein